MQTPHVVAREALSSAAVLLGSACLLPAVPPAALAARIAAGLWQPEGALTDERIHSSGADSCQQDGSLPSKETGIAEAALRARGTSLAAELSRLGPLSRVCALKGWLSMLPRSALCAPLPALEFSEATAIWTPAAEAGSERTDTLQSGSAEGRSTTGPKQARGSADSRGSEREGRDACQSGDADELCREGQWCFLVDGALPFACVAIATAPDAHSKFHAVALLTTCLQRVKDCLEVGTFTVYGCAMDFGLCFYTH